VLTRFLNNFEKAHEGIDFAQMTRGVRGWVRDYFQPESRFASAVVPAKQDPVSEINPGSFG